MPASTAFANSHRTTPDCMLLEGCEGHNGEVKSNHEQCDNDTGTM